VGGAPAKEIVTRPTDGAASPCIFFRMKTQLPPRPFLPSDRRPETRPSDCLIRALLAAALAQFDDNMPGAEKIAKRLWPDDRATELVLRSAVVPADTATSGWASQLAATSIADFVGTLGPASAAGELFRRATMLEFGQSAQINVPGIVSAATDAAWVAQGSPMPVRQLSIGSGATLTPKKLAVGFVVTRELLEHSIPNAERLIRAVASESVGVALDSAVLDATAAGATRPAGLRNSATSVTATTGGGDAAMMKDLGALAAAVAGTGNTSLAFIANSGEAVKILLRAGPEFRFPVLASGQLAAGIVMCVALPALVSAVDPAVRFDVSRESIAHLEDTSPLPISTTPTTIAAPVRSFWQTDVVGFRLRLEASWGLRASAASSVAFVTGATW
jgi:hypothetical protein